MMKMRARKATFYRLRLRRGVQWLTAKQHLWLAENIEALKAWNAYTARNGLPLAKYRMF